MFLRQLWLTDFRSYGQVDVQFADGLTAIVGENGEGKTNLLEAIGYLATLGSFRGAPTEALVRVGAPQATIRAEADREGRSLLIEADLVVSGRSRIQVNRQRLSRARDLLGALRVSVFAPDDLELIKGGPAERRRYVDDVLVAAHPRHDQLRSELDRVLRQRNALLRQSGGRLTDDIEATLMVWDSKFVEVGEALTRERIALLALLGPALRQAYDQVAHVSADVTVDYQSSWWDEGLALSLVNVRRDELRRGLTLVGPHRDDINLTIGGLAARTHASQGEQRSLALALRLAAHQVVTEAAGSPPVLLLDDVFSELDAGRSLALLESLPVCQTLLTSAGGLPPGAKPELVLKVEKGQVRVS
ncbi:MAG: DNA replication/repair protein RecF [Actinomycetes bacterium]